MNTRYDLYNKIIVVTGATSGIGLAAAIRFAGCGAFVIGIGRSHDRCELAIETIKKDCPDARVVYHVADLSSQKQVRELAENIRQGITKEGKGAIDVLINNAGTFSSWYVSTAEGFELQWAVNHLAPFLLTNELLPLLKAASNSRVITVSSGSHYRMSIHWNDIQLRKHYNCLTAYKQSKLANVLFTRELNRRLGRDSSVHAYAADPGLVNTEMGLKGTAGIAKYIWMKRRHKGVSPETAAQSLVYLAAEPSIQHSEDIYWKNSCPLKPSRYSNREDAALRLWEISEKMCGINR
jgi:NAD(P)-dependent dehydrogenase (short-subunit alcohol dehydrogenase family)